MPSESGRIEQRDLLRPEAIPDNADVIIRGGRDTVDKLRGHALRTARAWSLDGEPLFGVSVFVAIGMPTSTLLRSRFASFRTVHVTTAGEVRAAFELLATGRSPHFTVRLASAEGSALARLLAVLGPARDNPEYGNFSSAEEV